MEAKTLLWQKLFQNVGLSNYEARIYISLAVEGPSEARKLSMASGVPRTKAYAALSKLVERGLVVETTGKPSEFAIASLAGSFDAFLQGLKDELSEKVTAVVEFENAILVLDEIQKKRASIRPIEQQMGDVWFIRGRGEMLRRAGGMLSHAKSSVCLVTTDNGLIMFYKAFDKLLDKLAVRHVKIQLNAPMGDISKSLVHELKYECQVKQLNVCLPIFYLCVDKQRLLLVRLRPDDFSLASEKDSGFSSRNLTLCDFLSSLLQAGMSG